MTTPAFVQGNTAYQTAGTAPAVTLASAPTSGNLLVAYLYSGSTATTPAGWTLAHSEYYGYRYGYTFHKISDGTETGFASTLSATNFACTIITEWSGSAFGAFTEINHSATTASMTFGPSSAPISASSIPLAFVSFGYGQGTLTPGSPWTGQAAQSGTGQDQSGYYYEAAPNAAATLTLGLGTVSAATSQCLIAWIDPGTAPAPSGALTGSTSLGFSTTGTLSGLASLAGTAALALAVAGSLGGTAQLSGSASLPFSMAGTIEATAGLAGSTALPFTSTGTIGGTASLSGSTSLPFTVSGNLAGSGSGALSGAAALPFTAQGTLRAQAALSGSVALPLDTSASLTGIAPISGSTALAFGTSGTLGGTGYLHGSTTFPFTAAGTLGSTSGGALAGLAALPLTAQSVLGGTAALTGTTALRFTVTGQTTVSGLQPSEFTIHALPRNFLASLGARTFTVAQSARSFYRSNTAMTQAFPSAIDPAETKVLTIDATADLPAGVTLTGVAGSPIITVASGSYDASAAAKFTNVVINSTPIAAAPPAIPVAIAAGKAVQIVATGLKDGTTYDVRIVCSTTDPDNVTTLKGEIACTSR